VRVGAILLVAVACTHVPDDRPRIWSYLHPAIIAPNCATSSCHGSLATVAGLALHESDGAYEVLVDRRFVIAGDSASALLDLLEGNERRRMPPDVPLPQVDIDLVRDWIVEGAPR
jgi:hypothetical protein